MSTVFVSDAVLASRRKSFYRTHDCAASHRGGVQIFDVCSRYDLPDRVGLFVFACINDARKQQSCFGAVQVINQRDKQVICSSVASEPHTSIESLV